MGKKSDRRLTFWQNYIVGSIAGIGARTITSPLTVVKIISQTGSKQYNGFLGTFANVFREEGMKGFWRGNLMSCLRMFPYSLINFAAFKEIRKRLVNPETGQITILNSLFAGSSAAVIATTCLYPLTVVETRLTIQVSSQRKYKGIVDAFRVIFKEEGFLAFYQGLLPTIFGVIPFGFVYTIVSGYLRSEGMRPQSALDFFIFGCLTAAITQTILLPFDTISKKMQAQNKKAVTSDVDIEFTGLRDCISSTVKKSGQYGLWRGTLANLIKIAPYAALMTCFIDMCTNVYLYKNGYTTSPWTPTPKEGIDQSWSVDKCRAYYAEKKKRGY